MCYNRFKIFFYLYNSPSISLFLVFYFLNSLLQMPRLFSNLNHQFSPDPPVPTNALWFVGQVNLSSSIVFELACEEWRLIFYKYYLFFLSFFCPNESQVSEICISYIHQRTKHLFIYLSVYACVHNIAKMAFVFVCF